MEDLLKQFPAVIEIPVAWGEMDALGHLNNTVYFRYFESARMAYFDRIRVLEFMDETGIGPILASTSCRFRIPVVYPDTVWTGARIANIDADRFTMEYAVVSQKHQKLAAAGSGIIVAFDYRARRKTAIPEEIKRRIQELESAVWRNDRPWHV